MLPACLSAILVHLCAVHTPKLLLFSHSEVSLLRSPAQWQQSSVISQNLAYPVHKHAGVESAPPSPTRKADVPLASLFKARCHRREPEVTDRVNEYFLIHWLFKDDKAKKKFVAAGFSYVTCLYIPLAKNDPHPVRLQALDPALSRRWYVYISL